jgi:small subunit ribosomal protein S18
MVTDNQDQELHQGDEGELPRKARSRFKKKVLDTRGLNIDYKNVEVLEKFISKTGKILPRRMTGATARIQRKISREVKRARMANLLPFVKR